MKSAAAIFSFDNLKLILTDILVLACVYLIPTIAHFTPFPLYLIDPMRMLMLASYLVSRNNFNTYFIAFTIPLFSFFVGGHPVFYKAILISLELLSNIFLLIFLLKTTKLTVPVILLISIIASKGLYYLFKFAFIKLEFIDGKLITTGIFIQIITVLIITIIFSLFYKRKVKVQV